MKHSRTYHHLGVVGALTLPTAAIAAVDIPNLFEAGDVVSASAMNENFSSLAESIETLEGEVATLHDQLAEARSVAGYLTQPNGERVPFYRKVLSGTKTGITTTMPHGVSGDPATERRFLSCEVMVSYDSGGPRQTIALNTPDGPAAANYCDMDDTNLTVTWVSEGERDFQVSVTYTPGALE